MANINLNNLFNSRFTLTSKVDTEINLNKPISEDILYSDVKVDFKTEKINNDLLNSQIVSKDLAVIVNEEAIITSLRNILSTTYCSRLLNPDINFDLRSYLFESINEYTAYFIGYDIFSFLPIYEPRIRVNNIKVSANIASSCYIIDLEIYIPSIDKNVKLSSILNTEGISYT